MGVSLIDTQIVRENYDLLTWPSGSCGVRKDPPATFCASEVGVTSRNVYDV